MIKKTKTDFENVAKKHTTIQDIIYGWYRLLIPDFDKREKLNGFVRCHRETYLELAHMISDRMESLGCPRLQANFMWMNYGFSGVENVPEWEFDTSEC